jgi:hypothetical protein
VSLSPRSWIGMARTSTIIITGIKANWSNMFEMVKGEKERERLTLAFIVWNSESSCL